MAKISQIKLTNTTYDIDVASDLKATKIIGEDPDKIASVGAVQRPDGTNLLFDENNKISSHYISDTILGVASSLGLEATSDTADINLSYNSKYKLNVGNKDIVFKMPPAIEVEESTDTFQEADYTSGLKIATGNNTPDLYVPTGNTSGTVATGNHTHDVNITTSAATNELTLAHGSKYALTAGGQSFVFTMPSSGNTDYKASSYNTSSKIYLIGATSQGSSTTTGQTTYSHDTAYVDTDGCLYSNSTKVSVEGHTHDVNIASATSTATSELTLSHGSKYALTVGGQSFVFTMPGTGNTDYKTSSCNTSSKIYLIGATSQGSSTSSGQTTYSHDTAYVGTDGCLYSNSTKVSVEGHTHSSYANQNAFSKISIGGVIGGGGAVAANSTTDTVEFVGSNITITPDATNNKITFSVPSGSTTSKGIVKLINSTSSTSNLMAATANSVKTAYDLAAKALPKANLSLSGTTLTITL